MSLSDIYFKSYSGLGDKLLDIVSVLVYCKYNLHQPCIQWCTEEEEHPWGSGVFDSSLFQTNFNNHVRFVKEIPRDAQRIISPSTGAGLSIVVMFALLKHQVSMQTLVDDYINYARDAIRTSSAVERSIPNDLCDAIGIHLRRTDKIVEEGDFRHETHYDEYEIIIKRMKMFLEQTVKYTNEKKMKFFVCSEDKAYKESFITWLNATCNRYGIDAVFLHPNIETTKRGATAVVDMFCLSRCKLVCQGIKYSTFSMIACIIGNVPLYNFAEYDESSLIHIWKPLFVLINPYLNIYWDRAVHLQEMRKAISYYEFPMTPLSLPQKRRSGLHRFMSFIPKKI